MYKNKHKTLKKNSHPQSRAAEITSRYLLFLDNHIDDILKERTQDFMEISQIARKLAISHPHLIDVIQKEKGNSPSYFYDLKIIEKAKELLINSDISIARIALIFTYDPSNFSKFFKKWTGLSPGKFRTASTQYPKNSPY